MSYKVGMIPLGVGVKVIRLDEVFKNTIVMHQH